MYHNVIVSYSHARVCKHKCVNLPWWLWKNHVFLGFQGTWRCLPHEGPAGSTRMTVHFLGAPQSWLMPKLVISILMDWCTYGLIQATISGMHPSERSCTIHESQHLMMSYAQAGYDWTCFIETFTFNISKALKKENGETRAPQSSNAPQTKTCLSIGCLFILEVRVKLFRISGKGLVTNYLPFLSKNHS